METIYKLLIAKDTKDAMHAFKKLEDECLIAPTYAENLAMFLPALHTDKSCGRGRTFKFFMINARWDSRKFIETQIDEILAVLDDPKAPIVRQCIPYLNYLAEAKPDLTPVIQEKLEQLDLSQYKESMQSLLERDIAKFLTQLISAT